LPIASIENVRLFYRLEGNPDRPVLVFSHPIGADHGMWDLQVQGLLPHFRILRYDTRGHGASDAPRGEYSMEQLGRDFLGLADALGIQRFAFCGLSLGGMIGQWLGANAPGRLTALILANTSPAMSRKFWDERRKTILEGGMAAIVDLGMQRSFSPEVLERSDPYALSVRTVLSSTDPMGYAGCCSAIREMDHTTLLPKIAVPTLVIVGDRDVSTPWEGHGEILAREIPRARVVRLPAAHLSNIGQPQSFNEALLEFLLP
jgi:3-oxoadipate enol-lactonase